MLSIGDVVQIKAEYKGNVPSRLLFANMIVTDVTPHMAVIQNEKTHNPYTDGGYMFPPSPESSGRICQSWTAPLYMLENVGDPLPEIL